MSRSVSRPRGRYHVEGDYAMPHAPHVTTTRSLHAHALTPNAADANATLPDSHGRRAPLHTLLLRSPVQRDVHRASDNSDRTPRRKTFPAARSGCGGSLGRPGARVKNLWVRPAYIRQRTRIAMPRRKGAETMRRDKQARSTPKPIEDLGVPRMPSDAKRSNCTDAVPEAAEGCHKN